MSTSPRTGGEREAGKGQPQEETVVVPASVEPLIAAETTASVGLIEIGEVAAPATQPAPLTETQVAPARIPLTPKWAERLLILAATTMTFLQRPGLMFTDSRSDLTADPILFLSRVVDVWSETYDLGHVQSGQFVGYLFPMAPFYAGGAAAGIPMWIVQRVWLALILVGGAIGVSRLIGALWDRHDGAARLLAGLVFAFNPYVVTQLNRGTVTLLAYAVLPWLLVAAHRGVLEPRRWRWPCPASLVPAAPSYSAEPQPLVPEGRSLPGWSCSPSPSDGQCSMAKPSTLNLPTRTSPHTGARQHPILTSRPRRGTGR